MKRREAYATIAVGWADGVTLIALDCYWADLGSGDIHFFQTLVGERRVGSASASALAFSRIDPPDLSDTVVRGVRAVLPSGGAVIDNARSIYYASVVLDVTGSASNPAVGQRFYGCRAEFRSDRASTH